MKNETTRVRGRWDRVDSIRNQSAGGIFSAEHKSSPMRWVGTSAFDRRATSVTDEAVLAIVAAMNACSNALPSLPVSSAETARMKTTSGVDARAIQSCGADPFLCQSFRR